MTEHNQITPNAMKELAAALTKAILSSDQQAQLRAPADRSSQVQRYLRARRRRHELLGADIFADPAWDILLDLYVSQIRGRRVSVSSACIAANVPATTALRYVRVMCEQGLIERVPDTDDSRRIWLQLVPRTRDCVETIIDQMLGAP